MSNCSMLWIGPHDRGEFCDVAESLRRQTSLHFVDAVASIEHDRVTTSTAPDVVLLTQNRIGEQPHDAVSIVQERWPHADVAWLLGEWCCGAKRTCQTFGDAPVIYSHQLASPVDVPRLRELARGRSESTFDVPIAFAVNSLVAVYSTSQNFQAAICDVLRLANVKTIQLQLHDGVQTSGVDFVVWETSDDAARRTSDLAAIRLRHPDAEICGLMSWPRRHETRRLCELGVRVLAQPFELSDLFSFFRPARPTSASSAA